MSLLDTDLLYVDRAGTLYQVAWANIKTRSISSTDQFLIQRGTTYYRVPIGDFWTCTEVSTVNDYYLIERNGVLHHETILFPCEVQIDVTAATSTVVFLSGSVDPISGDPSFIQNPDGTRTFLTTTPTAYTLTQNGSYFIGGNITQFQIRGSDGRVDASPTPANVWDLVFSGVPNFGEKLFTNISLLTGLPAGLVLESLDRTFEGTSPDTVDLNNLDVSAVTSAVATFLNSSIDSGDDISGWDVSNVTNMSRMFEGTTNFNVDISGWDIAAVTDMSAFLKGASVFDQDLSPWAVPIIGVTNMASMFEGAATFNQDLSTWDVSSMIDASSLFNGASSFNQDLGDWDVSDMRTADSMFEGAIQYNQDLTEWCVNAIPTEPTDFKTNSSLSAANSPPWGSCQTPECGEMYHLSPTRLTIGGTISRAADIEKPDGTKATVGPGNFSFYAYDQGTYIVPVEYMTDLNFQGSPGLFDFAPCFYTGNITNMARCFEGCSTFNGDIANWDTSNVTNMAHMFNSAKLFNGPMSTWDTSQVVNTVNMFHDAFAFNQPIDTWDVTAAVNMVNMFVDAEEFNQDISSWRPRSATNMAYMFNNAKKFNSDLTSWDTSSLTTTTNMFRNASVFNGDMSGWDTSKITRVDNMFRDATAFNGNITTWNVSSVDKFNNMFISATSFNQDVSGWDVANASNLYGMFDKASSFNVSLNDWDVKNVDARIGFQYMFNMATSMSGDLSNWCVPTTTSDPYKFADNAPLAGLPANLPVWGTCPITDPTGLIVNNFNGDDLWVKLYYTSSSQVGEVIKPDGTIIEVRHANHFQCDQLGQYELPMGIVTWMSFHDARTTGQRAQNVDYTFEEGFYTKSLERLQNTFFNSRGFNGNITNWDVSSLESMHGAFINAQSFNGDISNWNTSSLQTMYQAFLNAHAFNSDISQWNTSNLINMRETFRNATAFNSDLSNWDTSKITDFRETFRDASSFNQYLNPWDVTSVNGSYFTNMFYNATAMEGDISNWCVSQTSSRPINFDTGAAFNGDSTLLPDWGNCGTFNGIYLRELVGGTGDLVIAGVASDSTVQIRKPDGTFTNPSTGSFANNYTQLGWYEIKNMESLSGLRFFDNDILLDDKSETAKFYFADRFDTSNLNEFRQMFREADVFDGDISMFDTSNATNMAGMFRNNAAFDGDLSHFNTDNVDNMANMFRGASTFNQDISGWAVYGVTCMSDMFRDATAFRKNISDWCVPTIASLPSGFDTDSGFDGQTNIQPGWGTCPNAVTITSPPVISQVNNTIPAPYSENLRVTTAATVSPSGSPLKGYQWQRSADGTTGWTDIPFFEGDATSQNYEVSGYDRNQYLRVVVTYESSGVPDVSSESNAIEVVDTQPPVKSIMTQEGSQAFTEYETLGEIVYGSTYFGASLLASDGFTVINYLRAPYPDSSLVSDQTVMPLLKFNTRTATADTSTELDTTGWGTYSNNAPVSRYQMFHGGTIVPDGRHLIGPAQVQNWLLYDYVNDVQTLIPDPSSNHDRLFGSVIWSSVTNKAYGIPYEDSEITEVDIAAGTVTRKGVGAAEASGTNRGWGASCEGPNGRIYLFPGFSTRLSEYDPSTNTLRDLATPILASRMWQPVGREFVCPQAVYVDSANAIYGAPGAMYDFIKLDFNNLDANGSPTPSAIPHGLTHTPATGYISYTYSGGVAKTEDGLVISVPSGSSRNTSPTNPSYFPNPMFILDTATDTVTQEANPFTEITYVSQLRGAITNIDGLITTGLITSFSSIGVNDYNIPLINTFSTPTTWDPTSPEFNHHL